MITAEERAASNIERIRILRDKYGDTHREVQAYDQRVITDEVASPMAGDRLTSKEVSDATETVPASPQDAEKVKTSVSVPIRSENHS
jgi:hypothetical protein